MHFAYPHNLWWLLAVSGIIALAVVAPLRRYAALRRLGIEDARAAGRWRSACKAAVRVSAVLLLGVALLGPCLGERVIPTPPVEGRDLWVLLDVSRSMLAEDVGPNRLERAKLAVKELATRLEGKGGYRLGLIAFAERPVLLCPLTTDFRHFREELSGATLQSVRLRETGTVAGSGSDLQVALERVLSCLPKDTGASAPPTCIDVLLVSDGGDQADAALLQAAEALGQRRVAVHSLGIGDPARDSPIPVRLAGGGRELLRHEGQVVGTRLQEEPLQQIAGKSGGVYLAARTGSVPLEQLVSGLEAKQTRELSVAAEAHVPIHRFQWFLLPAVLLLLMENVLSARGRRAQTQVAPPRRAEWLARLVKPPRSESVSELQTVTRA